LANHPFLNLEKESDGEEIRCTVLDKTAYQDEMLRLTELNSTAMFDTNKKP